VKLHADDEFELVAINSYDEPDAVRKGIEDFGIEYTVVMQEQSAPICKAYRVQAFPTYLVLDWEGRIRAWPGSPEALDELVEDLLQELRSQGDG
jgi:hypothetical protein